MRDFVVYYGRGPLPGIDQYDVAVLEPRGWSAHHLADLRRAGVTALAYQTVLEVPQWEVAAAGLTPSDFLQVGGAPWYRPEYDTYVVDPQSARWRRYVEGRVRDLAQAGWDGLFLDGLGDLEDERVAVRLGVLLPSAVSLVAAVRAAAPRATLVMNNAIWSVLPWVAGQLDGVCWEVDEPPAAVDSPHIGEALDRLAAAAVQSGVGRWLLTVVPWDAPDAARRVAAFTSFATSMGFAAYVAPCDYAQGIRTLDGRLRRAPGT
jgi:hypothetical protein